VISLQLPSALAVFPEPETRAQDKIEARVWKVGHKWMFTQGSIEVVGVDKSSCVTLRTLPLKSHDKKGIRVRQDHHKKPTFLNSPEILTSA